MHYMPAEVICAQCNKPVGALRRVMNADGTRLVRVECHGETKFVRFQNEAGVRLHEFLTEEIKNMASPQYRVAGLAERLAAAKAQIQRARTAVSTIEENAKKLADGAIDIAKQFMDAHDDMTFEATKLGNSSGASDVLKDLAGGTKEGAPNA